MRGQQLSQMAAKSLPKRYKISYQPVGQSFKNSILFLTKGGLQALKLETLDALNKDNNILLFDPVDAPLHDFTEKYADIIVAASRMAYKDYLKRYKKNKVMLLDHHVDPRLKELDWSKRPTKFKAAYFGEQVNTVHTAKIEKFVDFVQVDTFRQTDSWLKEIPEYNFHYAVRQTREIDNFKPFLKGFTAAYANSNMLIQDSQSEATEWLGEDYPYLLKGKVTEASIIKALNNAQRSYGTDVWLKGLNVMQDIKKKISDESICCQLKQIIIEADK